MIGTIYIKDLLLRCTIGIDKQEKTEKTDELINITLWVDFKKAIETDSIADTVNYTVIYTKILLLENEVCNLQETLVKKIIAICLEDKRVIKVRVSCEKPHILKHIKSAGIEIEAEQP